MHKVKKQENFVRFPGFSRKIHGTEHHCRMSLFDFVKKQENLIFLIFIIFLNFSLIQLIKCLNLNALRFY
jgi:hypothetical protein